jgi:hypothetical protein
MKINKILLVLFAALLIGCTAEEIPQPKKECFRVLSYRDEFYPNGFPLQISGQTVYKRRFYVLKDTKTGITRNTYSFFQFDEVGYVYCNDIKN